MPLKEIPRTAVPEPDRFLHDFVELRQPVVLNGLFADQELTKIATVHDAVREWGDMDLVVQGEYASAEQGGITGEPTVMSLRDYVAHTESNPTTRLCCTEHETPARVLASFELPPFCCSRSRLGEEVFGLPPKYGDFDLATNLFAANRGNVAHLHFDGDHRQVLLHQVYGRKRVVLFQPDAAVHLRTLDGPYSRPSLAGVSLEDMDLDEKLRFVDAVGGFHTVLTPGETLFIPMLMWHHLEYLDDAMSFNVRFGRTRFGRFLSLDNFHRDPYIQNVGALMVGSPETLAQFDRVIDEIATAYTDPVSDMHDRVRQMRVLFRDLCLRMCPDAHAEDLCPPEREEEQVSRIVASRDMEGGLKYAHPSVIAKTRPTGSVTPRQRDIIEAGFVSCHYSADVARAVVLNRLGKTAVDELTKAEAAQLITYLKTPGAPW